MDAVAVPVQHAAEPSRPAFVPLVFSEPDPPPTTYVMAEGGAHDWYTGNAPYRVGPGLRLSPGTRVGLSEAPVMAFAFDVTATARIGLHPGERQWVLVPELGWSWTGAGPGSFVTAGVGLGRGRGESRPSSEARAIFGGISYVPRFVLGLGDAFPAKGLRHGVLWDHGETTLSLEASHEVLWFENGSVVHALRAQAAIDVGRLLWLVASDR